MYTIISNIEPPQNMLTVGGFSDNLLPL